MSKTCTATRTKNYVVLTRTAFAELMARRERTERLAVELRRQLEEHHDMLMLALHQLARERGVPDRAHFVRRWLRDWRHQEPPVPLAPQQRGGGRSDGA